MQASRAVRPGRLAHVRTLLDSAQSAGAHTVRIESAGLAAGAYFCRLSQGRLTATRRIVVIPR